MLRATVDQWPPLHVNTGDWVYRAFTLAKHLSDTEQNTTVTAGKFLQLNLVMSPNSELRLYKLTKGSEQRESLSTFDKSYKKSPKLSLNLTLHPLAPTPLFPCLYKVVWKVPLILSQVLALVTLGSHVKSIWAKKKIVMEQCYGPLLTNERHCVWTQCDWG